MKAKRIVSIVSIILMLALNLTTGVEQTRAEEFSTKIVYAVLGGARTAVINSKGELYTWGYYSYSGTAWGNYAFPTKIMDDVVKVEMAVSNNAAITENGDLYVWGSSSRNGLLGLGNLSDVSEKPVKLMSDVIDVSLAGTHSAAVTKSGDLYVWGNNKFGEIGDGTTQNRTKPVRIMGNIADVELGYAYSAAITKSGELYVWGLDGLGFGEWSYKTEPVKVMDNVRQVSLSSNNFSADAHTAVVTNDGALYMWGGNYYGQLGTGNTETLDEPKKIMDNIRSAAVGDGHTAVITDKGELYIWGSNINGALGDGTTTKKSLEPIKILSDVAAVDLCDTSSLAVTNDGSLYVWGSNISHKLAPIDESTILKPYMVIKTADDLEKQIIQIKTKTATFSVSDTAEKKCSFDMNVSAEGPVVCKKKSGSKNLSVDKKGRIKVKKGTPAGSYTIKVRISAAATDKYLAAQKTVTVKVTVK